MRGMDMGQAIQTCEELFEKYGFSEKDKDWFVAAIEAMCLHQLHSKTGPFYQAHQAYSADKALEDVQVDIMIREEQANLAQFDVEIEAELQKARAKQKSTLEYAQRQTRWQEKLREVDELRDGLGKPVDAGIRETVAILQLLGLHTSASCEGHLDWGLPVPWVDLSVPEAEMVREKRMPIDKRLEVLEEGTEEFERVFTARNALWNQEDQLIAQAYMPLFSSLQAFYRKRGVLYEHRIIVECDGRLTIQGGLLQHGRDAATRARKLTVYQVEMRMFTDFLKQQFFEDRCLHE